MHAVHPPPAAISWLVTTVFWIGSAGVSVLLVIVGLLVPRLTAVQRAAVAALLTWGVCIVLGVLLGPAAGRPPADELAGLTPPSRLRRRMSRFAIWSGATSGTGSGWSWRAFAMP